jgi:hypothetical protein
MAATAEPSAAMAATAEPAATMAATTASAATVAATTAPAATTASAASQLYGAANVFPIEEMKRGETDVLHFLFAKNEALIGRGIVRLRNTSSGHRGP